MVKILFLLISINSFGAFCDLSKLAKVFNRTYEAPNNDFAHLFDQSLSLEDFVAETYYPVQLIEQNDEQFFRVRLQEGNIWRAEGGVDPQGDPTWVRRVLGKEGAKYFGFAFGEEEMVYPSAYTLMKAYQEFRGIGKFYLPISFYPAKRTVNIEYLRRFANNLELPITEKGKVYSHDIHFHFLSALLVDKKYVELIQNRIQIFVQFLDYLKDHHPEFFEQNRLKIIKASNFYVERLDVAFGGIANRVGISWEGQNFLEMDAALTLRSLLKNSLETFSEPSVARFLIKGLPLGIDFHQYVTQFIYHEKPRAITYLDYTPVAHRTIDRLRSLISYFAFQLPDSLKDKR